MGSLKDHSNFHCVQVPQHPLHNELTYVMGSPVLGVQELLHTLECEPDLVTWSAERCAVVCRGANRKLGFKIKTYQGAREAYTVITKVNDDCRIKTGQLRRFDRITAINNYDITHDAEQYIHKIIASIKSSEISLTLCRPYSFKVSNKKQLSIDRTRDNETNSSLNSSCDLNLSGCQLDSSKSDPTGLNCESLNDLCKDRSEQFELVPLQTGVEFRSHSSKTVPEYRLNFEPSSENKCLNTDNKSISHNAERNSSGTSSIESNTDPLGYTYKRGISQVSSSDSNKSRESSKSQLSSQRDLDMRRREKQKNAKDKSTKFVKTGSIENTDEEIEPLHPEECASPRTVGKLDKYSHTDSHSYSMPTTVSVADIVVEDPTLSLPLGFNNVGLSPSHASTYEPAMCAPPTDQRVCSKCVTKTKPSSPDVSLFTDSQFLSLPEEYSHMILQNPQYAVWDGKNTHVVEIDKGQSKGFGFSYKVKVGKNQDASMETYTLVESVDKDGPSKDKLHVADWIRSVNGTPIQIPMEAFTLLNSSNKQGSIRLVIQRPVRLSQSQQSLHLERDKTVQDLQPPSPQSPLVTSDQDPLIPGTIAHREVSEKTVVPPNICVIDSSPVDNCSKSLLPPFPKSVKLPKVRIFVCGSEADKCVKYLFKDSPVVTLTQNQCYSYASFSMASDSHGNVLLSQSCSNLFMASTSNVRGSPAHHADHRGGGDAQCRQCGCDITPHTSVQSQWHSNTVNIQLFVVPDERFFHYCCCYLFTKSSIFILTFDGSKLLRSAASEFSRLESLSHTIRSVAGEDSHIMSCGLIEGGPDYSNIKDEVRALFYTPLNSVLNSFHVFGPELINTHISNTQSSPSSNNVDENQLLQTLWKVVTETVLRFQILQPSLLLIDHLVGLRERESYITESQSMEIIQGKMPNYQQDVHQMVMMDLIENREILLGKACSFITPSYHKHIESLIMTKPESLLTCLQRVVSRVTDEKPYWLKTHSTGYVSSSNFLELCGENHTKSKQLVADFMECNGIILRKPNPSNKTIEYFFPYFGVTPSSADKRSQDNQDCELYLKFIDHVPSQIYFVLLFTLGSHCDTPASFNVQDIQTCVFEHGGYHAAVHHHKVNDRIRFVFKREDKTGSLIKLVDLYTWLKDVCHHVLDSLYIDFVLGAPCPRGDNCDRTTKNGIHIVNLSDRKPQYCDTERIDTMKTVKMWKQKDVTTTEGGSATSGSRSNKPAKQPVTVLDLPHSVLHNVCARLKIPSDLGRDWKGLAGLMGYTNEKVQIIETMNDPVLELLYDWTKTNNGKIEDLVQMLEEMNLENVLTYIRQALPPQNNLNTSSTLSPSENSSTFIQNSSVSLQTHSDSSNNSSISGQVIYQRSRATETTEVMPIKNEGQGHTIRLNNLDGLNKMDNNSSSSNQAITPVETVLDINRILKS